MSNNTPDYEDNLVIDPDKTKVDDLQTKLQNATILAELEHRLAMVKANGKYPDRISRLKSRVVVLSEENAKLKEEVSRESYKVSEAYCYVNELKELLKEIRQRITEQVFGSPELQLFKGIFDNKLLDRIDEVLK